MGLVSPERGIATHREIDFPMAINQKKVRKG